MNSSERFTRGANLGLALVGFGAVCENAYLPWIANNKGVELKAIVEGSPLIRAKIREKYPYVDVLARIDDLPNSVQLLIITTPPVSHAELICEGLHNRMNVFCEKPFVLSLAELQLVSRAKAEFGGLVGCCHNWYFSPPLAKGLHLVRSGAVGTPQFAAFDILRPRPARGTQPNSPNWRKVRSSGGGIIRDLGYHAFYLLSSLFGRTPSGVTSSGVLFHEDSDGADTEIQLRLDYGSDCFGEIHLSWNHEKRTTLLDVSGSAGRVICTPDSLCVHTAAGIAREDFDLVRDDSWHANWTASCLDQFLQIIRTRDDAKICSEITSTVATLDAACASATSIPGKPVPINVTAIDSLVLATPSTIS